MERYPPHIDSFPANMTRWPNVGLMLGQRRSTTLDQRIVFAGLTHIVAAILNRSDKITANGKFQVPTACVKYVFLNLQFLCLEILCFASCISPVEDLPPSVI